MGHTVTMASAPRAAFKMPATRAIPTSGWVFMWDAPQQRPPIGHGNTSAPAARIRGSMEVGISGSSNTAYGRRHWHP